MSIKTFAVSHARAEIDASGIATLTIEDAGVLNILSTPVIDGLRQALARLCEDESVRVLVLRGASDRATASPVADSVRTTAGCSRGWAMPKA